MIIVVSGPHPIYFPKETLYPATFQDLTPGPSPKRRGEQNDNQIIRVKVLQCFQIIISNIKN